MSDMPEPGEAIAPSPSAARPACWMLGGAFFFATMAAMVHSLGDRCDWLLMALVRIFLTFLFSVILAWMAGARLVLFRPATLWLRSLAGCCSLVCNFYALPLLPLADVITLANTYPIWIVLISWLKLRRLPVVWDIVGVACGTIGVVLIQRPHFTADDQSAALVALLGSVATAVAMLGLHQLKGVDPRAVVAHFSGVATAVAGAGLLVRHDEVSSQVFDANLVLMLLGIGLTGTIGQVLLTRAYAAGAPTKVAMVALTQVIFGLGFDVAFLGRQLTAVSLLGILMVLAPAAWLSRGAELAFNEPKRGDAP